jgi:hypothetical protein
MPYRDTFPGTGSMTGQEPKDPVQSRRERGN